MSGLIRVMDLLFLLSLGMGYLVLYFAKREDKGLKLVGYFLGIFILVLTIVYMLGDLMWQNRLCNAKVKQYRQMIQSAPGTMPRPRR